MIETPRERLLSLLKKQSFKKGEFVLASGKKSDFFIDCKKTVFTPEGLMLVGQVILDFIEKDVEKNVTALAAVPLGGCPLVDATSVLAFQRGLNLNILYIRPEKKDHGTGHKIEGIQCLQKNARVILVEDVVTTGNSSLGAVEVLKQSNIELLFVLTLIDRLEGCQENFSAAGIPLKSVFSRKDFLS